MNFLIKTIKGKVLFGCVPMYNRTFGENGLVDIEMKIDEGKYEVICRLSEITEEHASLLVESVEHEYLCGGTSIDYKEYFGSMAGIYSFNTAKKSLLNLLEGNGCWVKGIQREVQKNDFCYFFDQDRLRRDIEAYENAADDYLLIIKQ